MSLIQEMMEECVILNKAVVSDGEGGHVTKWDEGATIKVAITQDTSITARIAEKDGFTNTYTLTMAKEDKLEYHEVIKRLRDGLILRVTNDNKEFPNVASDLLNKYTQVNAERWELT